MQSSLGKTIVVLFAGLELVHGLAAAAALDQIKSLSFLPALDLAQLKRGEVVVERGPNGDFPRGVHLQSCYFVHAPLSTVGDALLHWNPIQHHDPEIRLYREYAFPGRASDFETLRLDPDLPNEKWLLAQSRELARGMLPRDLHLTKEEVAPLREKEPNAAWQRILLGRSRALAAGGLAGVVPYGSGQDMSPATEFRGLLSLQPKVAHHFQSILGARPLAPDGKAASEVVAYWEAAVVHEHTTLQLGLFAAQKGDDSWQLVDCIYYPSDTYFMALDLFQLWPVEGGTLVWQAGFVSAPFRSYLGGIDRFVAGKLMTDETIETIKVFRAALEKGR